MKSMSFNELQLCLDVPETILGQELLSWFASQLQAKVHRDEFTFTGQKTYRFSAHLNGIESLIGFGRSQDELTSAVKACAEAVERKVCQEFFKTNDALPLQLFEEGYKKIIRLNNNPQSIPFSFHNSNGWAVGFSASAAIERAKREALERHLLLLTFIKDGWNGFYEISKVVIEGIEFTSLVSKYNLAGYSAGIGIAKSNKFNGVSFGYLCDKTELIETSPKWEQVFYEAYDYLRIRSHLENYQPLSKDTISQELHYFLEKDFNEAFSLPAQSLSVADGFCSNLAVIDLAKSWGLEFPFYAAVVHGGDLLPLYFKSSLSNEDEIVFKNKLTLNQVYNPIPERHPIL